MLRKGGRERGGGVEEKEVERVGWREREGGKERGGQKGGGRGRGTCKSP